MKKLEKTEVKNVLSSAKKGDTVIIEINLSVSRHNPEGGKIVEIWIKNDYNWGMFVRLTRLGSHVEKLHDYAPVEFHEIGYFECWDETHIL